MTTRTFTAVARCSLLLAALGAGCGGSSDTATNPLDTTNLTAAEKAALASQLMNAGASVSSSQHALAATPGAPEAFAPTAYTVTPNGSVACNVSGHITYTGNLNASATATAWSIYGGMVFQVGDRTNNLNDCEVAPNVILDGTLNVTIAGGSAQGGVGWTMNGQISVNRRGPTGGLVPAGSCWVMLDQQVGAARATGTVCSNSF